MRIYGYEPGTPTLPLEDEIKKRGYAGPDSRGLKLYRFYTRGTEEISVIYSFSTDTFSVMYIIRKEEYPRVYTGQFSFFGKALDPDARRILEIVRS